MTNIRPRQSIESANAQCFNMEESCEYTDHDLERRDKVVIRT